MIKLFLKLVFLISVLNISACNATEISANTVLANDSICELNLGNSSDQIESIFDKNTIYTENGEDYVYRGLICNKKVLVDVNTVDNKIDIISIKIKNNNNKKKYLKKKSCLTTGSV